VLRTKYLKEMKKELNTELKRIGESLEKSIPEAMENVAQEVVNDSIKFSKYIGLETKGAFLNVPTQIVSSVASGKLYANNWTLSKAIWSNIDKTQQDINTIVAKGVALNKSAFDIAKDLEQYVDPKVKKDWNWSKVYPNTSRRIDYNAQRLARTMVSHAYQQSLVETTRHNPFVTGFKWQSAAGARTCPICADRNGKIYGKLDLPLDHPNGRCTYEAVMNMDNYTDRIVNWYNSPAGTDKELDKFADSLSGKNWRNTIKIDKKSKSTTPTKSNDIFGNKSRTGHFSSTNGSNPMTVGDFKRWANKHFITKYSDSELEKMYTAVNKYTNGYDSAIRTYQATGKVVKSGADKYSDLLEKYIYDSPKFDSEIYRGVRFSSSDDIAKFKLGQSIDMKGLSSWSSDYSISKDFAINPTGVEMEIDEKLAFYKTNNPVIFKLRKTNSGASIKHLSHYAEENEVVVSKDAKFKIVDIVTEPAIKKNRKPTTIITLEEV
jgi:SPP1 gp7 family putative phage head morphogenesis protein